MDTSFIDTKYFRIFTHDEPNKPSYRDCWFYCPGCGTQHPYRLDVPQDNDAIWTFKGSWDKPTFEPSLLCNKDYPELRCHLFVVNGVIRYCGDCHHQYAGKNIKMVPIGLVFALPWEERSKIPIEVVD